MRKRKYTFIGDRSDKTASLYFDTDTNTLMLSEARQPTNISSIIYLFTILIIIVVRPLKTTYLSFNYTLQLIAAIAIGVVACIFLSKFMTQSEKKKILKPIDLSHSQLEEYVAQGKKSLVIGKIFLIFLFFLVIGTSAMFYVEKSAQMLISVSISISVFYFFSFMVDSKQRTRLFKKMENKNMEEQK